MVMTETQDTAILPIEFHEDGPGVGTASGVRRIRIGLSGVKRESGMDPG